MIGCDNVDVKTYFYTIINNYIKKSKGIMKINTVIQGLYNKYGYGYTDINDTQLLNELQNYNILQDIPYLATGQNGYFHNQIMEKGLGNFKLNQQDIEDAKFISSCFGKRCVQEFD